MKVIKFFTLITSLLISHFIFCSKEQRLIQTKNKNSLLKILGHNNGKNGGATWINSHYPVARQALGNMFLKNQANQEKNNKKTIRVSIEAVGSGTPLIESIEVNKKDTVFRLRNKINDSLPKLKAKVKNSPLIPKKLREELVKKKIIELPFTVNKIFNRDGNKELIDGTIGELGIEDGASLAVSRGISYEKIKLVSSFLLHAELKKLNFQRINLKSSRLGFAELEGSDLTEANFSHCQMYQANLKEVNLERAVFREADLKAVNFEGANLEEADFKCAQLVSANFVRSKLIFTNFMRASLKKAKFQKTTFHHAVFDFSYSYGVDLQKADLRTCSFNYSGLERANLIGANLEGVSLTKSYLRKIDLRGANLKGANLEGANLEGANLEGANLEGANLEGTILWGIKTKGANFKNAKMRGSIGFIPLR